MSKIVPSAGPLSAKLVFVGESPGQHELAEGLPFVGKAGKMLNAALRSAGVDRTQVRLMNCVPVRAPQDRFALHSPDDVAMGQAMFKRELGQLREAKVFVALGANPATWLLGARLPVAQYKEGRDSEAFIGQWRGSVIPSFPFLHNITPQVPESYLLRLPIKPAMSSHVDIVLTYHPAAILRQMTWHPWFLMDVQKAASIVAKGSPVYYSRRWYVNDVAALRQLAASGVDLISVDTELSPPIVAIVTKDEVHVFEYTQEYREPLEQLLTSKRIVKIAHNWPHDYADFRVKKGITVSRPLYDTQGAAHVLNTALQKELSPHIATRYTNWPYHKWLVNHDPMIYCGMDGVVCYDAYWPQVEEAGHKGFLSTFSLPGQQQGILNYDHKLLLVLMDMQAIGFRVDEGARVDVEIELNAQLVGQEKELQALVAPVIEQRLPYFKSPHLFQVLRKCDCCGGGKLQQQHCASCGHFHFMEQPDKATARDAGFTSIKAFKLSWPSCRTCEGKGKVVQRLPFNPDSPVQLADVIYRGLRIRPRRYKGAETVKAAQLDPLKESNPIVAKIVETSKTRADFDTIARLRAGDDSLLHCVFDPWGTGSGRVAGKEGLLEQGTNPMNLPKLARRFIVARPGMVFLYPDMAQIEARVVAVLSKDRALLRAFTDLIDWPGHSRHGTVDSHTKVVQLMLAAGVVITRDQAKRLTYAAMYGGRADQLAKELNAEAFRKGSVERLTTAQVQLMLDVFYKVFYELRQWQTSVAEEVLRSRKLRNPLTGREFTWLGYILETNKRSPEYGGLKYEIKKQVWSRLPQDTGAYVLGLGLIDIYESDYYGTLLQPLVHVHDALLIEAPEARLEEAKGVALAKLSRYIWGMSFPASMKTGKNWLECS